MKFRRVIHHRQGCVATSRSAPREIWDPGDFYFFLSRGGVEFDFSEMSSREQAVFPLIYDFARLSIARSIVLIDELELHLHPPQQQALLSALPKITRTVSSSSRPILIILNPQFPTNTRSASREADHACNPAPCRKRLLWFSGKDLMRALIDWYSPFGVGGANGFRDHVRNWMMQHPDEVLEMITEWRNFRESLRMNHGPV